MCNKMLPTDVYHSGYLQKQAIKQQFSEDIRHVIHGGGSDSRSSGPSGRTGSQNRSSSLSAGAALALGACRQARDEANDAASRNKAQATRSTCPFDNHEAFQRREPSLPPTSSLQATAAICNPEDRMEATQLLQQVKNQGRYNRDIGQKVGAPAPFDTPETQDHCSRGRRPPPMPGSHGSAEAFAEARAEALKNRQQNGLNTANKSLISGEYRTYRDDGVGKRKPQMSQSAPEFIMPTGPAQMKMKFDGVSINAADEARKAYYNAATMREEARLRNGQQLLLG